MLDGFKVLKKVILTSFRSSHVLPEMMAISEADDVAKILLKMVSATCYSLLHYQSYVFD